jgi:hypothetical protein
VHTSSLPATCGGADGAGAPLGSLLPTLRSKDAKDWGTRRGAGISSIK